MMRLTQQVVRKLFLAGVASLVLLGLGNIALAATPESIISGNACQIADEQNQQLAGCTNEAGDRPGNPGPGLNERDGYLTELINVFIYAAGFLAFVFLLIGAVKYVTSTGDAKRIQSAKDTVMYSLIGLIVVILARLVVGFIIENAT